MATPHIVTTFSPGCAQETISISLYGETFLEGAQRITASTPK